MGLDYAEIALDFPWPDKISPDEVRTTMKILKDSNIDIAFHSPLGGLLLYHPRKEIVEAGIKIHEKCLRVAEKVNPLYYTFHIKTYPGVLRVDGNREIATQNCFEALNHLTEIAAEMSINLVVENSTHTGYLIQPEKISSQNINLNLDIGHWFAGGYSFKELEELILNNKEKISLLHIHDVKLEKNFVEDHLPLGQGNIDFNRVFHIIKNVKYKWINLEMHPTNYDIVKENISKVKDFLK